MSSHANVLITTRDQEADLVFIESDRPRLFVSLKDGPKVEEDIQIALQEVITRTFGQTVKVVPLDVTTLDIVQTPGRVMYWAMVSCDEELRVA